jgi:hypothetical protein
MLKQARIVAAFFFIFIGLVAVIVPGSELVTHRETEGNIWLGLIVACGAGISVIGISWAKD